MDELVLQIAQMYRQDVLALPQDEDYKGKRHAAYRHPVASWTPWCRCEVWGESYQAAVFGPLETNIQTNMDNMLDLFHLD